MTMPEAEVDVTFDFPLEKVWKTLKDLTSIGSCQRFVEKVEALPDGGVRWTIKSPMSKVTRTPHVDASFTNLTEKRALSWKAKGNHLLWAGDAALQDLSGKKTKARLKLEVQGLGALSMVINQLAGSQVKGNLDFFAEQVKRKLEE